MNPLTLAGPAEAWLEVKKSRHRARAAPIEDAGSAEAFIATVAAGDRDANHHCWAWRVGPQYRSSDDGEPSGTAGRPILAAIDGAGLDRVVVVVSRWFGGIKLGAGGLVRAYGGVAAEVLRTAPRVEIVVWRQARLRVGFGHLALAHALLQQAGGTKHGENYDGDGAVLRVVLPADRIEPLATALRDASRGLATLHPDD